MNKMCTACGLVKEMPVDFDIDDHNMTGYTAQCKECRGTLPVAKPKRKYNKTRRPRRSTQNLEKPVEVSVIAPEEIESIEVPVVVPDDEIEDDD